MRIRIVLSLLLCAAPALAHDTLDLREWGLSSDVVSLGGFTIDHETLAAQLQREPAGSDAPDMPCTIYGRINPNVSVDERTYWENRWMGSCGGVLSPHWNAATRLALRYCERLSIERGIWPPAIPVVHAPASYNDADHHAKYRIEDGQVQGICVIEQHEVAGED